MPHDNTLGIPHLTKFDFEQALERHHFEVAPKLAAFNPAEFAKKAAELAKFAPAVLAFAAAMGVTIPPGTAGAIQFVIQAAEAIHAVIPSA